MTVTDTSTLRAEDILRGLAAYGLNGTQTVLPTEPLSDEAFPHLMRWIHGTKLIGMAAVAVENGALPVTAEQRSLVVQAHLDAMGHGLRLERLLLRVADALTSTGVEFRVLKGSAVAQLDYEDSSFRPFVDLDILVQSDAFELAVVALESIGVSRLWHRPRPGFDRRFGKGATLRNAAGYEVDLHRTFVLGPWGLTVNLSDLWASSREIEVGGTKLLALADEARLMHAAIHATLGHSGSTAYVPSRDLAEMILFGAVDVNEARRLAESWQMSAVLAEAVSRAWRLLDLADVTSLSAWAETYRPTELDERRRAVYRQGGATFTAKSLAALGALPRFRDRVVMAGSLAFPSRQFLSDRGLSYRDWMRHGIGGAVRSRRTAR